MAELSTGVSCENLRPSTNGLSVLSLEDFEVEKRTLERLRDHYEAKIKRLKDYKTAIKCADVEIAALMIEKINPKLWEYEKKLAPIKKILPEYYKLEECINFTKGEWCQFLLMGNKLTSQDILKEWNRVTLQEFERRKEWKQRSGKRITEEQIQEILRLHRLGVKQKYIAQRLGISAEPVRKYIKERLHEN